METFFDFSFGSDEFIFDNVIEKIDDGFPNILEQETNCTYPDPVEQEPQQEQFDIFGDIFFSPEEWNQIKHFDMVPNEAPKCPTAPEAQKAIRRRKNFTNEQRTILNDWIRNHDTPYLSKSETKILSKQTNLTTRQIRTYLLIIDVVMVKRVISNNNFTYI